VDARVQILISLSFKDVSFFPMGTHEKFRTGVTRLTLLFSAVAIAIIGLCQKAQADFILVGGDPIGTPFFTGTFNPPGDGYSLSAGPGSPAFLNNVSGGSAGHSSGELLIGAAPAGQTALVAFAIHVTDTAGPSHSLSALNDPALADVVNDLNHPTLVGSGNPVTVYAYADAPAQYAGALALLSADEATYGGQPFDILATVTVKPLNGVWATDFSNALGGHFDGMTALSITDIGAIPEPSTFSVVLAVVLLVLSYRRRSDNILSRSQPLQSWEPED
jgi:hypothetical protein